MLRDPPSQEAQCRENVWVGDRLNLRTGLEHLCAVWVGLTWNSFRAVLGPLVPGSGR